MFAVHTNVRCRGLSWLVYEMVSRLVTHGWLVPSSSDGTTYSAIGNVIARGHLYAQTTVTPGSPVNANAWFRLRHPLGSCELLFHHSTSTGADAWKILYSRLGFTGGAPNATTPPTATDEVYILGSSGGFTALIRGLNRFMLHVTHFIIGDADEDYAFAIVGSQGSEPNGYSFFWFLDRVSDMEDPADDPTVVGFGPASDNALMTGGDTWTPAGTTARAWAFMSRWQAGREVQMRAHGLLGPSSIQSTGMGSSPVVDGQGAYEIAAPSGAWQFHPGLLWWWRRPLGAAIPVNTVIPLRSPRKGKSRIFRMMLTNMFGTYRPEPISYINNYYLPVRVGGSFNASGTWLLVPWMAGQIVRW